ncbi:hypothetical protein U1737_07410 [Sphingomonas sp. LB3N6]|uniref:hypothetical protein n=1 Tax=Sphingomonas fucosidasi TaxID=3096164 RepID=UPI002FC9887C
MLRTFLAAFAMMLSAGTPVAAAPEGAAKRVLFLMRADPPGGSADPGVIAHLNGLGYIVTTSDGLANAPDPCGFDLVVMSSTVQSNRYTADRVAISQWRDMGVPLLTWENDLLDDLRFTGMRLDADFGEVETGHYAWIVRAPHPLAGGIPAGMTTWTEARQPAGWGKPGLGADIVMVRPGEPDKAMLFGYERGATMDYDYTAPARRVFIGLENNTFGHMTDNGRRLFDASLHWAAAGTRSCGPGRTATGRKAP